jgi:3-hydroxyacyl-CoA dehydrogenase/enoyl-CoA hydratase/3-hydroxybutyryl-CoA epimerase
MRHWNLTRDAEGLARLVFDKAGATTNTLSADVLAELNVALDALDRDPPKGLVIASGKANGFIAGADIDEFGEIRSDADALALVKRGWDTFNRLAAVRYPTLALVRGFCLGGGLELALACRYRIVVDEPSTRLGLPEVLLGIVPGWGGITRLPRLAGGPAALDLLLTGKTVDARKAKRLGIADQCVAPDAMDAAARGVLQALPAPHRLGFAQGLALNPLVRRFIAGQAAKAVARRARREHYPAPYAILALFARYDGNPLAPPASDPASIASLLKSPTAMNLIRVYRLQERLKGLGKDAAFKAAHVHVVGAGSIGADIAGWCALRGLTVTLEDPDAARLAPAVERATKLFAERSKDPQRARAAGERLSTDAAGGGAARADAIIEATAVDSEAKRALLAALEAKARPDAMLATHAPGAALDQLADGMRDASRLVGLHFFDPVARTMLVEVVTGRSTRPELAGAAAAFVRQIDKLPLPVKSAPGLLVDRLVAPYVLAAMRCVDVGTAPEVVDAAAQRFGMATGPIELADSVGLDACAAACRTLAPDEPPPRRLSELIEAGHLGRKTKRGFYDYASGKPAKAAAGAVPAGLAARLVDPLVGEARKALAEGIVADADLVDAAAIFGIGFAPYTGGPLHYAEAHR